MFPQRSGERPRGPRPSGGPTPASPLAEAGGVPERSEGEGALSEIVTTGPPRPPPSSAATPPPCRQGREATVDLLACDCALSRIVFGPQSEIIDLGQKTRVIPPALRRAVIARDRHCRHPGCYRPAKWCDVDHILAWQNGGQTRLDNLQLLAATTTNSNIAEWTETSGSTETRPRVWQPLTSAYQRRE